jgi:hypothetical protein
MCPNVLLNEHYSHSVVLHGSAIDALKIRVSGVQFPPWPLYLAHRSTLHLCQPVSVPRLPRH